MAKDEKSKEKKGSTRKEEKAMAKSLKQEQKKAIKDLKQEKKKATTKDEKKVIKNKIKEVKKSNGGSDSFIGQVIEEMKLVRWPSAKEVVKYSLASLAFIIIFAVFFFGIDALFSLVKDLIG